jgi:hypothetical protein
MLSEELINTIKKNAKFVARHESLKVGHLYLITDRKSTHIMVATSLVDEGIKGDLVETTEKGISKEGYRNFFAMERAVMSPVIDTDEAFDKQLNYAFYEIGSKEEYPEFFL